MEKNCLYSLFQRAIEFIANLKRKDDKFTIKHYSSRYGSNFQIYYPRSKLLHILHLPFIIPENASYCSNNRGIFINGGRSSMCYSISLADDTISQCCQYPACVFGNSVIYSERDNSIISVGGQLHLCVPYSKAYKYIVKTNEWAPLATLNEPRSDSSLCIIKNTLYSSGGFGRIYISSIEKLNLSIAAQFWEKINLDLKERVVRYTGYNYLNKEILMLGKDVRIVLYSCDVRTMEMHAWDAPKRYSGVIWREYMQNDSVVDGSIYVLTKPSCIVKINCCSKEFVDEYASKIKEHSITNKSAPASTCSNSEWE